MGYFLTGLICLIIGGIGGGVAMLFVLKNNPKYVNFDKLLRQLGRDKLEELKKKINEINI